jgi:NAD-dependent protein deacetylase/lipoamidase
MTFPQPLIERLRTARHVAVLSGAGISAESGVATFRDAQSGLWSKYRPEDLATPEAFERNPRLVWEWYAWRREGVAGVSPNPGHVALAEMEGRVSQFTLITQNVDGLHHRAGSKRVIELHGNITRTKCFEEDTVVENWKDTGEVPPRCPRCGGRLRPDVVWFGETLPAHAFEEALEATRRCEIFFSIGTSSLVYPAASLPHEALESGAVVVEINPAETPLTSRATYSFQALAGRLLPLMVQAVWNPGES